MDPPIFKVLELATVMLLSAVTLVCVQRNQYCIYTIDNT